MPIPISYLTLMLSRTLGVMFKVKQLFTKKYLLSTFFAHYALFSSFSSFEVNRSQNLKVSKSYQNNEVTSIKKLLGIPNSFSLYYEIILSDLRNSCDL